MLWQHKTGATSLLRQDKTGLPQIGLWSGSKLVRWGEGEIPVCGVLLCFNVFYVNLMMFCIVLRRLLCFNVFYVDSILNRKHTHFTRQV